MSRSLFAIGLVISLLIHLAPWLLDRHAESDDTLDVLPIEFQSIEMPPEPAESAPPPRDKPQPTPVETAKPAPVPTPAVPPPSRVKTNPPTTGPRSPSQPAPSAPPRAAATDRTGSFAGNEHGQPSPRLYIDWQDAEHALRVIQAGRLKLVVLEIQPQPQIVTGVRFDLNGRAQRTGRQPDLSDHDPEVRYVTRLPAFATIARSLSLKPREEMALVLPRKIAEAVRLSQQEAIAQAHLTWQTAANTAGRFQIEQQRLVFKVFRVVPR